MQQSMRHVRPENPQQGLHNPEIRQHLRGQARTRCSWDDEKPCGITNQPQVWLTSNKWPSGRIRRAHTAAEVMTPRGLIHPPRSQNNSEVAKQDDQARTCSS